MGGMECVCLIDGNDWGDPAEFYHEEHRKARKEHVCCECDETIKPGEMYEHVTGKWEDEIMTYKTCDLCVRIRNEYCCSWVFGQLREEIRQALGVDYVSGWVEED